MGHSLDLIHLFMMLRLVLLTSRSSISNKNEAFHMKPAVKGELGWKSADVVLPEGLQVLVNTKGQVITKMRR